MKTHYVGYLAFSKFKEALDPLLPVNYSFHVIETPSKRGFSYCASYIAFSQAKADEVIYFRFMTGRYQTLGGSPLGDTHQERGQSAMDRSLEILAGFHTRHALLAIPKNLTILDGDQDLIQWEKESDRFILAAPAAEDGLRAAYDLRFLLKETLAMFTAYIKMTDTYCDICETHARKHTDRLGEWNGQVDPIIHKEDCIIGMVESALAAEGSGK